MRECSSVYRSIGNIHIVLKQVYTQFKYAHMFRPYQEEEDNFQHVTYSVYTL